MQTFDNLIGNRDRGPMTILVDPSWDIVLIDHSRGFDGKVVAPQNLPARFDHELVQKLRALDQTDLEHRLGGLLDKAHVEDILRRRDNLLKHIQTLVDGKGEEAVLF